ncbi:4,5-DOPA dioxygenase extradiol [Ramlibacter sp. MMS24-I3-19]|uniref:4,5-DOPA-extradiol-dioxygenase n=1 Tax=Ramlibacter sp. MMS24-I3-19 TaxID=3416606 RepID=UPI003D040EF1
MASLCAIAAGPALAASSLAGLSSLPKTARMPILFVGHGSPMNAIQDNPWRPQWEAIGRLFGQEFPRPALILCISAHWLTDGWWVTGAEKPKTVHDFGGFPQALFDQQYPAPGAPALARALAETSPARKLRLDTTEWGYDHGAWSVLKPMFPAADIPVLQLSMDYNRPPAEHLALASELKFLRDRGVLIVGSGNVVHNLRATRRGAAPNQAYDWAHEFDSWAAPLMQAGDGKSLAAFLAKGDLARLAHPSHDHMLPLIHAVAAVNPGERARQFGEGFQSGSISMRSVLWG